MVESYGIGVEVFAKIFKIIKLHRETLELKTLNGGRKVIDYIKEDLFFMLTLILRTLVSYLYLQEVNKTIININMN